MHRLLLFYTFLRGRALRWDEIRSDPLLCGICTVSLTAIASMALWACNGSSISPLRALSLRSKCNLVQTHRTRFPTASALYCNTRSSAHTAKTLTTPTTWIDRLPRKVQPYLYLTRIDKPIGTLLLFYPCSASPQIFLVMWGPVVTVPSVISLVNHHGLIRAQRTPVHPSEVHRSVWSRCVDHARGGVHHQRPVGPEPGQCRWCVRSHPPSLRAFHPADFVHFSLLFHWPICIHH